MTTELAIKYSNVGGVQENVQCPNCSRMYPTKDDQDREVGHPPKCTRCGCPMVAGKQSDAWMNEQAEKNHDPRIAAMGRPIPHDVPGA